ncbi:MAG: Grx4 family monothiol glutaredoxin [Myxococcota bacterium]
MPLEEATRQRIQELVDNHPVLLFMKGERGAPQCGFSATVVQLLDQLVADYETRDVLSDPELRAGIKEFSEWPTIPQLYVKGEFVGGCDIITELYDSRELHTLFGLDTENATAPTIEISETATGALVQGLSQAPPDQVLRLLVDARHQARLVISPSDPSDFVVHSGDVTLHVDPLTAARAQDAKIDAESTRRGMALKVLLPHAPAG